jgi:hypothetical protein
MQGTGYVLAMHYSLRQRSAAMRALISEGEDAVVGGTKNRDGTLAAGDNARSELRNIHKPTHVEPFCQFEVWHR